MGSVSAPARRLLAAAGAIAVVTAAPAPASAADCAPPSSWGTVRPALAAEVGQLVNQHRAGLGLSPLATSPTLTAAATWKSLHMASGGAVVHDDPHRTWYQRIWDCGYPGNAQVGENIAAGHRTAREVMAGWLDSPGHRSNIEHPGFAAIGVGAAADARGVVFWTQDFGSVVDATTPQPAPPPPPAPPAPPPAPAAPVLASPPQASASCRTRGRRVRCSVGVTATRVMRARLVRRGRIRARSRVAARVLDGTASVTLHARRRVGPGRYTLVLLLDSGARRRERLAVTVRPLRAARGRSA